MSTVWDLVDAVVACARAHERLATTIVDLDEGSSTGLTLVGLGELAFSASANLAAIGARLERCASGHVLVRAGPLG